MNVACMPHVCCICGASVVHGGRMGGACVVHHDVCTVKIAGGGGFAEAGAWPGRVYATSLQDGKPCFFTPALAVFAAMPTASEENAV